MQENAGCGGATGHWLSLTISEKRPHEASGPIGHTHQWADSHLQQLLGNLKVPAKGTHMEKSPRGKGGLRAMQRRNGWGFAQGGLRSLCQFSAWVRNTCGGPLLVWGVLIFPNGFLFSPGSG